LKEPGGTLSHHSRTVGYLHLLLTKRDFELFICLFSSCLHAVRWTRIRLMVWTYYLCRTFRYTHMLSSGFGLASTVG